MYQATGDAFSTVVVEHKGLYVQEHAFLYLTRILSRACVYGKQRLW